MSEDYSKWIDLGDIDPAAFVRTVHELSSAQGMGFLSPQKTGVSDQEMKHHLDSLEQTDRMRIDYIGGRSGKISLHKHEGHYFIPDGAWYDHSDAERNELLARFGVGGGETEHGPHCQCEDCKPNDPIRDPNKALELCGRTNPTAGTAGLSTDADVLLKNGSKESRSLVAATMVSLNILWKEKPIVIYELAQLCRNPDHGLWGLSGKDLEAVFLVNHSGSGYSVHGSIRNIVLSAVRGDGEDMTFGSPIKE